MSRPPSWRDEQGIEAAGTIVMQGDAVILAARFADPAAAGVAYERLRDAEVNQELNIDGVLVADADADGKIHIRKLTDHHTRRGHEVGDHRRRRAGRDLPAEPDRRCGRRWDGRGHPRQDREHPRRRARSPTSSPASSPRARRGSSRSSTSTRSTRSRRPSPRPRRSRPSPSTPRPPSAMTEAAQAAGDTSAS